MHTEPQHLRPISEVDDDIVMAVLDGDEVKLAHLQQERNSVVAQIENLGII